MSIFLLIGFVMFIFVAVVMSFAAQHRQEANQEQADNVASALLDSTTVRTYIQSCVSDSANRAFLELMQHGGFYPNITIPGNSENLNEEISFVEYNIGGNTYKSARLLYKSQYDINPMYPCSFFDSSCGYGVDNIFGSDEPGKHYCGFSLDNETQVQNCNYGDRQPISLYFVPNSIANQLRYRVSEKISKCIEGSFFSELFSIDSADVSPENIETSVSFGSTAVSFMINIPLVIQVGRAESISISSNSHNIEIDFARMFNNLLSGSDSALYQEWSNLYNDIYEKSKEIIVLNRLDYEIEQISNINVKDDLFIIRHKELSIAGEPFEFRFIIGNRKPVLSEINYAKNNPHCEIEVPPETNVTIELKYADPDRHDVISARVIPQSAEIFDHHFQKIHYPGNWESTGNIIHKEMPDRGLNYVELILVEISDGQYRNSQDVRVCVDYSANLNYEPSVEFYYDYSGFNTTYTLVESNRQIPRITLEDPIKLRMGDGFSGKGTWEIGDRDASTWDSDLCEFKDVTSNCIVFPGGTPCDDDFEIPIDEIKNMIKPCFSSYNTNQKIYFLPADSGERFEIDVRVDECVPHIDDEYHGDNLFLTTNSCCTERFRYSDSSKTIYQREDLMCSMPLYPVLYSNDFYLRSINVNCLGDRGNYFDEEDDSHISYFLHKEVPSTNLSAGRNCLGCGVFGTVVDNDVTVEYDYALISENMGTFEQHFYQDDDPISNPYICNPSFVCTDTFSGSGRGAYDDNSETGIMLCQGACNRGECDFAVNCVCTNNCGESVSSYCLDKSVGEKSGTCTKDSFGQAYFPEVCGSSCKPIQQNGDLRFKCDDPFLNPDSDCLHCDPLCDGKRPNEDLNSCDAVGSTAVRDSCNEVGQVVEKIESGGRLRCVYDPNMNCNGHPSCHNVFIDELARDGMGNPIVDGGSRIYLAAKCNEDCHLVDSNLCYRDTSKNDVEILCHNRERGEGFHLMGPSQIHDSFCSHNCGVLSCPDNFAYKGGDDCMSNPTIEECCYNANDLIELNHFEVCNDLNPNTEIINACVPK